jgi:hypothetical protein
MRYAEFLLEYNRDITIKNTNPNNILNALKNDDSIALTPELEKLKKQLRSNIEIKPEEITNFIEQIVVAIEQKDPTNHKEYTPWLVRMYSKGNVKYEDLNRMNMLGLYDVGKKRRIIRPEHKDINKFKTYQEFEDVMFNNYPPDSFEKEEEQENSIAKKVFEDNDVLVVIPKNEAAACKYGKNTKWCTAATQGQNYFEQYNKKGPLYILIPKKPKYKGEKYQLHFETNSFMNEKDSPINLKSLLTQRFPSLDDFFKEYTKPKIKKDKEYIGYYEYRVPHREDGPAVIQKDGTKEWWVNGKRHREDGPAVIRADGTKSWWVNGERHREGGPAVIRANGTKVWYLNGQRHREDGPAVEWADGAKMWYLNGDLHRKNGPAIEYPEGRKEWWVNGNLHRKNGPAIEYPDGTKEWWVNGKRHRKDGPAIIRSNGTKEWWINGEQIK